MSPNHENVAFFKPMFSQANYKNQPETRKNSFLCLLTKSDKWLISAVNPESGLLLIAATVASDA